MKKETTKQVTKPKKPTIKVTLKVLGKFYNSQGKTVEEALTKLDIPMVRGVGVLALEKGEKKRERILGARLLNGIFGQASPSLKAIAVKNIGTMFEDFN